MKEIFLVISLISLCISSRAQRNEESDIRRLEELEGQSWVNKDTTTLYSLFSPDLIVNTPLNRVATLEDVKQLTRRGKIDVTYSEKTIEKITFINNMAVVMGRDIVKPKGSMQDAGKTVTRSYTDVWIKNGDSWMLTIRQATNISVK